MQIWTKHVNDKGGLNGHPVKLLVYDDSGDPARHRAQVQEAIEQRGAIAFLVNPEELTGQGSVDYITSKQVPLIGTGGGVDWAYSSPMYFPAASDGEALYRTIVPTLTNQLKSSGKKKLGTVVCVEAQGCGALDRIVSSQAAAGGFEQVYRAKASIAQPDFTAECLAARNAGAEIFLVILDGNSVSRLAASCARQGFKPQYATVSTILLDRFKDDPNLNGLIAGSQTFPWFQSGTPASDEYQRAFKTYGRGLTNAVGTATGWLGGKLLEQIATDIPEPPTSAALLKALWALRGETLGGLTYPLRFTPDKPAEQRSCWYNLTAKGGSWTTPDGFKLHCI